MCDVLGSGLGRNNLLLRTNDNSQLCVLRRCKLLPSYDEIVYNAFGMYRSHGEVGNWLHASCAHSAFNKMKA